MPWSESTCLVAPHRRRHLISQFGFDGDGVSVGVQEPPENLPCQIEVEVEAEEEGKVEVEEEEG